MRRLLVVLSLFTVAVTGCDAPVDGDVTPTSTAGPTTSFVARRIEDRSSLRIGAPPGEVAEFCGSLRQLLLLPTTSRGEGPPRSIEEKAAEAALVLQEGLSTLDSVAGVTRDRAPSKTLADAVEAFRVKAVDWHHRRHHIELHRLRNPGEPVENNAVAEFSEDVTTTFGPVRQELEDACPA